MGNIAKAKFLEEATHAGLLIINSWNQLLGHLKSELANSHNLGRNAYPIGESSHNMLLSYIDTSTGKATSPNRTGRKGGNPRCGSGGGSITNSLSMHT